MTRHRVVDRGWNTAVGRSMFQRSNPLSTPDPLRGYERMDSARRIPTSIAHDPCSAWQRRIHASQFDWTEQAAKRVEPHGASELDEPCELDSPPLRGSWSDVCARNASRSHRMGRALSMTGILLALNAHRLNGARSGCVLSPEEPWA